MRSARHHAMFDLSGRTALATGCRRGIGKAIAVALAEAGADIIGASAQLAPDSDVEQAVIAAGRSFTSSMTDLSDRMQVYELVERVADQQVDILVRMPGPTGGARSRTTPTKTGTSSSSST
jgi:2-deoxy-D-gluconate 3-dehydrogenase